MEIWKDITEFENLYQISNSGKIKRLEREMINNGGKVLLKEKLLKQQTNHKGYKVISLGKGELKRTLFVHRLVSIAFIPNPDNKPQINHKDFDKSNNNYSNLEWVTNRENITHKSLNTESTSKFIGVHWNQRYKSWVAQINISGNTYSLGNFENEYKAGQAYNKALKNWIEYKKLPIKKYKPRK